MSVTEHNAYRLIYLLGMACHLSWCLVLMNRSLLCIWSSYNVSCVFSWYMLCMLFMFQLDVFGVISFFTSL